MNNRIKDCKVLVTGGAGFIGSNLVESLLLSDNFVICLDNFSTGHQKNIEEFKSNPSFRLIKGDIRNYDDCLLAVNGVDIVFHQAALGSVPRSLKDPATSTDVNIGGFVRMLTASKESGVKRFIYAASSSTYGDNAELPKLEENIGNPLSPYAVTKYADELFAQVFALNYKMEVIGLRYFNVYGPKQDPDGAYAAVIPKFIQQLKRGESPVINGDGSISRDFTYIDNVINANHLAAIVKRSDALNQVYNVACGESTSLLHMFEIIRDTMGASDRSILDVKPVFGPEREGDIRHSLASVSKAEKLLGYKPAVGIDNGLPATVKWFMKNF